MLKSALEKTGRFEVRVTEEARGLTREALAGYDAVLLNYNGPRWGNAAESAVEEFVRSGRGLISFHGVTYGPLMGTILRKGGGWDRAEPWRAYPSTMALLYTSADRNTYDHYLMSNSSFHQAVATCSRNERLKKSTMMAVLDRLQRPLYVRLNIGLDAEAATAERRDLVEAIKAHDAGGVREVLIQQSTGSGERMVAMITQTGFHLAPEPESRRQEHIAKKEKGL